MPCQLPADCLHKIFEHLEKDKVALHSCLLVNRLCCKIAIRILWRNIWNIHYYKSHISLSITHTLVACLPNESKELMHNNGIIISPPTRKPPMFNYAAFVKELSISNIYHMINTVLKNQQNECKNYTVLQEIMKMFMIQIPSLNILDYTFIYFSSNPNLLNIPFTYFPGATDCLTNLSELRCSTNISPEFFYHLAQTCYNINSLTICFEDIMSNGLKDLIFTQKNLKHLKLFQTYGGVDWTHIIPSLTKHSMTLTKLNLESTAQNVPISFISLFSNLQELRITFYKEVYFKDFEELQHVTFPKLQILKIPYQHPKSEHLMEFLENNGKNLRVLKIGTNDTLLNLSIAQFCPNIKKLFLILKNDELGTLKIIFNNCKYLESIKVWCGEDFLGQQYLNEKDLLKLTAECSPSNFYELKLHNVDVETNLFPEDLDSFLTRWKNRVPLKLFSLIISRGGFYVYKENKEIIEKYENLGILKFVVKDKYQ